MLELHCSQTKNSVPGHRMDWVVHDVVAAARRTGILAVTAAAVAAEQRYPVRQPSRELEHHAEGLAVADSERSADFVSLHREVSAVPVHPWM